MSRMRQIPIMDATQRERVIKQSNPQPNPMSNQTTLSQMSSNNNIHSAGFSYRPRSRKAPATKFRLSDTPALLSTGCTSLREFCNGIQNITVDLNNLIGSVESILPLLTTYLTTIQARAVPEQPVSDIPIDVTVSERPLEEQTVHATPSAKTTHQAMQNQTASQSATPHATIQSSTTQAVPVPRPEDLQQLLENPLVKNLMANFMQGTSR